jgi:hypothetical protein
MIQTDLFTFLVNVEKEFVKARTKFPSNEFLTAALLEECGELANALLEFEYKHQPAVAVYCEAMQVAALAARIAIEGSAEFSYSLAIVDPERNRSLFDLADDPDMLTKLNILAAMKRDEQTSENLVMFDGTNACLNCGRVLKEFEGVTNFQETEPGRPVGGRFCNENCVGVFKDRRARIERVSEPAGPDSFGGSDFPDEYQLPDLETSRRECRDMADRIEKDPDPALHVSYYDGDAVPADARRCSNCKRWFTGPAKLDARETFCSNFCQGLFEYGGDSKTGPAVELKPAAAQTCPNCLDVLPDPGSRYSTFIPDRGSVELCSVDCLVSYGQFIQGQQRDNGTKTNS